jgi:predicted DNA-binding protein
MAKKEKPKETEMLARLTFDVPQDLHRRLKILAINSGKTMRELILEWIKAQLERSEKK